MTARIPLWPGALATLTERGTSQSVTVIAAGDLFSLVGWPGETMQKYGGMAAVLTADLTLDLTDPDTFRGAVARLAERLGAPPDAVAQGCRFWLETFRRFVGGDLDDYDDTTLEDFTAWLLKAGDLKLCRGGGWAVDKPGNEYSRGLLAEGITDPAEALAAAWAQVLAEVKP